MILRKTILLAGITLLFISSSAQVTVFNDSAFRFSFEYPESWINTGRSDGNLRAIIVSPDKSFSLAAYGFFLAEAHFDIEKYAGTDKQLFPRMGEVLKTDVNIAVPYIGKYIGSIVEGADEIFDIRKDYEKNESGYYARGFFAVDGHYAYALIIYSPQDDFSEAESIFDSFETTSTWLSQLKDDHSWAYRKRNLIQTLFSIAIFIYLSIFVFTGRGFRKWTRRRKALLKFRKTLGEDRQPDKKWHYAMRHATRQSVLYFLLFIVFAIPVIFFYGSSWVVLVSIPFFFLLGFMGYSIVVKEP
jgi:hypothetical protein